MTCADYQRHELACPHHGGTRVGWWTADGCSGSMCSDCWQRHQVHAWADLTERIAGPAEGLEMLALLRALNLRVPG